MQHPKISFRTLAARYAAPLAALAARHPDGQPLENPYAVDPDALWRMVGQAEVVLGRADYEFAEVEAMKAGIFLSAATRCDESDRPALLRQAALCLDEVAEVVGQFLAEHPLPQLAEALPVCPPDEPLPA
ncbi:hypothetical protein ACIPLC_36165 [Kitasatospora sp. NPDC086801]|uniref:hypothetical protein n=1 Tax=Kitasatospora sp. NPDC086801 TaxID=3364066 RepID=UPI0038090602